MTYPNPNIKEPKKLIDMDDLEVLESSFLSNETDKILETKHLRNT